MGDIYPNQFFPKSFINPTVGGNKKLDKQQTSNQIKVLDKIKHDRNVNKYKQNELNLFNDIRKKNSGTELQETSYDNGNNQEKYDTLVDWNEQHGLVGDTRARYTVHYLHIDSSYRHINPEMEISNFYTLDGNPFSVTEASSKVFIKHPDHTFSVDDKITIEGFSPISKHLIFSNTKSSPLVEFITKYDIATSLLSKSYMVINYAHGISETYKSSSYIDGLYIEIKNFNNNGSSGNSVYYGNIPLQFINGVHNFILSDSNYADITYSATKIYIELPYIYSTNPGTPTTEDIQFELIFHYDLGVPMNMINANYPTDIYHSSYYQTITEVNKNGYYININTIALNSGLTGGNHIQIGYISSFTGGYAEPNNYVIQLEKSYKNIVSVCLKSIEIPNSEYVIKNYPTSAQNNKIYWQNYEDGTYVYSTEITTGKYTPQTLVNELEQKFYNTPRYYYPSVHQSYTNHNYIKVDINTDTDTTTFSSYKEAISIHSFRGLYYIGANNVFIPVDIKINPAVAYLYPLFIVIEYENHNMTMNTTYETSTNSYVPDGTTGDTVIISGSITYMGIPGSQIDGTYEAYIINQNVLQSLSPLTNANGFMIKLNAIDITQYTTRSPDSGGGIFKLYTPNKFRLLFNYSDTIGKLLGFSNVGETYAVTKYDIAITNKDSYQPDINVAMATDATTPGNAIILSGYNYILMVCNELPVIETTGTIKSAFAKLLLTGSPGKMLYNSNVYTPKLFTDPISELSQLTISFYTPNGDLYDFNGLDHSFTLELITLDESPSDTHINTHTGHIVN